MSSWWCGNTIFEITIFTWVFKYEVQKLSFFLIVFKKVYPFFENLKNVICFAKWSLKVRFWKHTDIVYFWDSYSHSPTLHQIATVLRIKQGFWKSYLYSSTHIVPSGFRADLHARPERPSLISCGLCKKYVSPVFLCVVVGDSITANSNRTPVTNHLATQPPATQPPSVSLKSFFLWWLKIVASHKPFKDPAGVF